MLSVHVIERHFRSGNFGALLEAIATNGLTLPLSLKLYLSQSDVPAVALGLRRLVDLTYGPTALSREMVDWLLHAQRDDGSFDGQLLATAAAAAAFARMLAEPTFARPEVNGAHEQAVAALVGMQEPDGLFRAGAGRTDSDRALAAAFMLTLLSTDPAFRASLRLADLMTWFEERGRRLEPDIHHLWQLARADQPAPRRSLRHRELVAA